MAVKPVVYDDSSSKHRPLGSGERMDGLSASSIISVDSGNLVTTGSDGLVYATGSGIADPAADNLLGATSAGKLKVDIGRIIEWLDGHPSDAKDLAEAINVVSGDSGNLIHEGTDGGAYMSSAQLAAAIAGLTAAQLQAIAALLAPGLADGLTVVLNAAGKLSVGDISGVAVAASGASGERALGDRFGDVANVKDFGAEANGRVGYLDASMTGNTAAVQDAVDAAAGSGRTVWVPSGVYYYRSEIDAKGVQIVDDSIGSRILLDGGWNRSGGMKLAMHRGLSAVYPENTLLAFDAAGDAGAWGVETDVQWTSDGYPVCIHDGTVDRTTDGTGDVSAKTLAQIRALDAGSHVDSAYASCKVPTLDEFLSSCRVHGCVPIIEIKAADNVTSAKVGELVDAVRAYGMESSVIFSSFDWSYLHYVRLHSRFAGVCGVRSEALTSDNLLYLSWLGGRVYYGPDISSFTSAEAALCRNGGIGVYAWTLNTRIKFDKAARLGCGIGLANTVLQ